MFKARWWANFGIVLTFFGLFGPNGSASSLCTQFLSQEEYEQLKVTNPPIFPRAFSGENRRYTFFVSESKKSAAKVLGLVGYTVWFNPRPEFTHDPTRYIESQGLIKEARPAFLISGENASGFFSLLSGQKRPPKIIKKIKAEIEEKIGNKFIIDFTGAPAEQIRLFVDELTQEPIFGLLEIIGVRGQKVYRIFPGQLTEIQRGTSRPPWQY